MDGDGLGAIYDKLSHLCWLYDRSGYIAAARTAGHLIAKGSAWKGLKTMEKVIIPTLFGFVSMMSLWAITVTIA
jgi:hypothetical protein